MGEKKVHLLNSIGFRIQIIVAAAIIISTSLMVFTTFPRIRENTNFINRKYLLDMTVTQGKLLQVYQHTKNKGLPIAKALTYEEAESFLKDVTIGECISSYAYLVDSTGMMIYHADKEKIGKSVENVVITQVVNDLSKGIITESSIVEYEYRGETKYAGFYVEDSGEFVLVITVDKEEIFSSLNEIYMVMVVVAIITVIAFIFLVTIATNMMLHPLRLLTGVLLRAADLDFTESAEQVKLRKRKDESGMISRAVEELHNKLREVIFVLTKQGSDLTVISDEFSRKFNEITKNVRHMNGVITEIANASALQAKETSSARKEVAFVGQLIEQNTENVQDLDTNVRKMEVLSRKTDEILSDLVAMNHETSEDIQIVAKRTQDTYSSASKISDAVVLIQNIASQTNLLSLNASIEAARAGEAGRGFSVVAEEIRKLADDSAASAGKIDDIVKELLVNSDESVKKMAEVTKEAKEQQEKLLMTKESFEILQESVTTIEKATQEIWYNTREFENEKVNVSNVLEELSELSQGNFASTKETSEGMQSLSEDIIECQEKTHTLSHDSAELHQQMKRFKI